MGKSLMIFGRQQNMSIFRSETNEATKRRREDDGNEEGNEEEKFTDIITKNQLNNF